MTKQSALYQFFSQFGLPAYEENSVYSMENTPEFPYLTYEVRTDSFSDSSDTAISFSIWYRSTSWIQPNAKSSEISATIGNGKILTCDDGYILIQRGHPFAQNTGDNSDDMIKRIVHNLTVRYYTNY